MAKFLFIAFADMLIVAVGKSADFTVEATLLAIIFTVFVCVKKGVLP